MSSFGVGEWKRRAHQHRELLDRQIRQATDLRQTTAHKLKETHEARDAARVEAATAFLPAFEPVSLELCERLAGLPPGWAAAQQKKVHDEDVALAARISQIEHDEKYMGREKLLGPQGEWKEELAAVEKELKPLDHEIHRYEGLPSFRELIETGYGTDQYSVSWYQPSYYRLWKHADEACEQLKQEPFELIRQLYLQQRERRDQKKQKRDEVLHRVQGLERLVHEHDQKGARRQALRGPAPLDDSRKLVGEWLASMNRRNLAQTLRDAGRADLLNAVMKLDAIEAKSAYFESMLHEDLGSDLQAERNKLLSDMAKYDRPKKAGTQFPAAALEKRFSDRPARWQRRLEQRQALLQRIDDWDDYDQVDYDEWGAGTPWWFVFSGRSDPGYGTRFQDVNSWMQGNPQFSYSRRKRTGFSSPFDDAAAALANQQRDDSGGRDVS